MKTMEMELNHENHHEQKIIKKRGLEKKSEKAKILFIFGKNVEHQC